MKFKVTDDNRFLIVTDATQLELEQLESSFTKKLDNFWIIKKQMQKKGRESSGWTGDVRFVDRYHRVPIGLWKEILDFCKEYNFSCYIEGSDCFSDKNFDEKDFDKWINEYFKDAKTEKGDVFFPWDTQLESAKRAIKYRFCTQEVSTSGGKTLISFMIFKYLFQNKKINKILYVVPNVDLVVQSHDEWEEYENFCVNGNKDWNAEMLFSEASKVKGKIDVTFGTYQSLNNKSSDFFTDYDFILIDETHHAKANSIKGIISKCYKADWYRLGLTGTLPKPGSCDWFTIQSYLGPKVYVVHSHELINSGKATPINVIQLELDYVDEQVKKNLYDMRMVPAEQKEGSKLLNFEKEIARDSRKRFNYIVNKIAETNKNSLVLFGDIKNGYGRKIYDWLRENTDKRVFYIDGGTSKENREFYKKEMEKNDDVIIVASSGTFSEGISIKNMFSIFITESNKSENIVRQILGRGMRLLKDKDKVIVIDFSDNYRYGSHKYQKDNYLIRHAKERESIYNDKLFPFKKFKIKL